MTRQLLTRWYAMLLALFAPALAFAQSMQNPSTNTRPDYNPGTPALVIVGLVFLVGIGLIFFRRYSNDWNKRSSS